MPACWRGEQAGDRALEDDAAVVDHHEVVADRLDLGQQVARDEDRDATVGEPAHHGAHLADAGRVEAVGRLVEDAQLGSGKQRRGDAEPLLHAERVGAHEVVAHGR